MCGGGPDTFEQGGHYQGGGGHGQGDQKQQQRVDPRHQDDRPGGGEGAGHQVDQRLGHDVPEQGGVGGHAGDQVAGTVPMVLMHFQPQQARDEAVAQSPYDAFTHAFQDEAPHRAGRCLGDEQRGQEREQRPEGPSVSADVDDVPGDERLGQSEGRTGQGEHGGDDDGGPVPGGEPVHGGDRTPCRTVRCLRGGRGHRVGRLTGATAMSRVK